MPALLANQAISLDYVVNDFLSLYSVMVLIVNILVIFIKSNCVVYCILGSSYGEGIV